MKPQTSNLRHLGYAAAVSVAAATLGMQFGCAKLMFWRAKPQAMHSASEVPASQGTVKATTGKNGNTDLSIRVKHLAPPSKIVSDATVYVVWIQPKDGDKQNIGALVLNDNLEGSLDTVTPHSRFSVSVTPEASGRAAQPGNAPVFTYEVESTR